MIETILQQTEKLQELLDRRARLLADLQVINHEVQAAYLIVMGGAPPTNGEASKAIAYQKLTDPPHSAARANGTPRRGRPPGKTRQKALAPPKKKATKTTKGAPKVFARGEAKAAVLGVLKSQPKRKFTNAEVAKAAGCTRVQATNALSYLKSTGGIKKSGPGVFQYKSP